MSLALNCRARTGSPYRPITSFPYEVLEMIVKAGVWNCIQDLAALALAHPTFYKVVMPILCEHVRLIANEEGGTANDTKVASLFAFLVFQDRNKRAKSFRIIDPTAVLLSHPHGFQLETALHGFTHVTSFQLPFHLITNHLFDILHQHSSVVNLHLDNFIGDFPSHFRVKRRYEPGPRRSRLGPITLRNFHATVTRPAQPNKLVSIESFLSYLASFKFILPTFTLSFQTLALHTNGNHQVVTQQGPFLPSPHHLSSKLEKLTVELNDHSQSLGYFWLRETMSRGTRLAILLPKLKTLELSIGPSRPDQKGKDVFSLAGRETLPHFEGEQMVFRMASTTAGENGREGGGAWTGLGFRGLKAVYGKDAAGGGVEDAMGMEKLEVGLGRKSVVLAGHVASLCQDGRLVGGLKELGFEGGQWGGKNWMNLTHHLTQLPHLTTLSFTQSLGLTPLQTLSLTLACSDECYANLLLTRPAHHLAAQLVGGHLVIFQTLVQISFNRLLAFGPSISIGTKVNLVVESTRFDPLFDAVEVAAGEENEVAGAVAGGKKEKDAKTKTKSKAKGKGGSGRRTLIGEKGREILRPVVGRKKIIDLTATRTGTGGWEDWSFGGTLVPSLGDGECFCCGNGKPPSLEGEGEVDAPRFLTASEGGPMILGGSVEVEVEGAGGGLTMRKDFLAGGAGSGGKKEKEEREKGVMDPIRSLMACPREEVREALSQSGVDLEELDARTPSSIDPMGWEGFLRGRAC